MLLVPALQRAVSTGLQPIATAPGTFTAALPGNGLAGQFIVGAVLGLVWSPCTGPSLGAAVGLAAAGGTFGIALGTMVVYGLSAAMPLRPSPTQAVRAAVGCAWPGGGRLSARSFSA